MSHIKKMATIKNATAILEYNPSLSDNHIAGDLLDHIRYIQTIVIKVDYRNYNSLEHHLQIAMNR